MPAPQPTRRRGKPLRGQRPKRQPTVAPPPRVEAPGDQSQATASTDDLKALKESELVRFVPTLDEMEHSDQLLAAGWDLRREFTLPDTTALMLTLAMFDWSAARGATEPEGRPIRVTLRVRSLPGAASPQAPPKATSSASPQDPSSAKGSARS